MFAHDLRRRVGIFIYHEKKRFIDGGDLDTTLCASWCVAIMCCAVLCANNAQRECVCVCAPVCIRIE